MRDDIQALTGEPALSDEDIVARVRAGEVALFELVMRRHNARIFRAARSIVRDDDEAEDIVQEAYVNAYAHLDEFEGRAQLSTWLTRIAVHEALARARRSKRWTSLDDEGGDNKMSLALHRLARDPEESIANRELLGVLESAVDALPGAFRAVFVLRVVEGMSISETAEVLDAAEETIKTRLFRARALLKDALMERAIAIGPQAFEFHLSRCDRVVDAVMRKIGAVRAAL